MNFLESENDLYYHLYTNGERTEKWDLKTMKRVWSKPVWALKSVLSKDGKYLFGCSEKTISITETFNNDEPKSNLDLALHPEKYGMRSFRAHDSPIHALAISPDGKTLFSGGKDWVIKKWNVESLIQSRNKVANQPECFQKIVVGNTVQNIIVSIDSKHLFVSSGTGLLSKWDCETGKNIASVKLEGDIQALQLSSDGRRLYTISNWKTISKWSASKMKILRTSDSECGRTTELTISLDGKSMYITAWLTGEIHKLTNKFKHVKKFEENNIQHIRVSKNGDKLYIGKDTHNNQTFTVADLN